MSEHNKKKFVINQVPKNCNEGPFWGNGTIGGLLYVEENILHFAIDHTELWEMRESLVDEPRASFQDILEQPKRYLHGDPSFITPTNIFSTDIGRTRLPGLSLTMKLPDGIKEFYAEIDLANGYTKLQLILQDERTVKGAVYLNSCINILEAELFGKNIENIEIDCYGWDISQEALEVLKRWEYPSSQCEHLNQFTNMYQIFSGNKLAAMTIHEERMKNTIRVLSTLNIGSDSEKVEKSAENQLLIQDYIAHAQHYREMHEKSWSSFWNDFNLTVPNQRLQEAFQVEMYKIYCNERHDALPVTLQGIWNMDKRMPAWYGDWHNDLNVQACYWAAFKTGNVDLVTPYIHYYFNAIPRFNERAKKLFGVENAIHIPTMMALDGYGAASEWCFWNTLLGPELYVSIDFCWYYEFSQDRKILREKIYPFLKGVLNLYEGIAKIGDDRKYHIPMTHSPEVFTHDGMLMKEDSTFIISSLQYVCNQIIKYAEILQMKEEVNRWKEFKDNLVEVKTTEKGYPLFPDQDVFESHRHFTQLFPIFPLNQDGHSMISRKSLEAVIDLGFTEYAAFSFPYLGILAARNGYGNMARTMLEIYCMGFRSVNSFTVNGDPYYNGIFKISDTNAGESSDVFTLEAGFMLPAALCEMFVHRIKETIYILPAIPDEWMECSCSGLTVEGGHEITITMEKYRLSKITILPKSTEPVSIHFSKAKGATLLLLSEQQEKTIGYNICEYEFDLIKDKEITILFHY